MHPHILKYNERQGSDDKQICDVLAFEIARGLPGAESKLCDHEQKLAFLESTNERNVPFYERHGFEVLGTVQVGSSPTSFSMLRRPR
jgi:hypothetical protein